MKIEEDETLRPGDSKISIELFKHIAEVVLSPS